MSDKRTHCPTCSTTYKVTVAQLTIAQGMVCCPKCTTSFNALSHLVAEAQNSVTTSASQDQTYSRYNPPVYGRDQQQNTHSLLYIFDQKVEHSNIDLETYLNNLNYFSTEPISVLPSMNWEDQAEKQIYRGPMYYIGWSILNLMLFGVLLFQFFWFNPQYIKNSHIMSLAFNNVCEVFNCSNLEKYYTLIQVNKVKIKATSHKKTEFSGELINFHDRSLALPILKINLEQRGEVVATYNLSAKEYLIESLVNIERIPKNSPFKFKFELPVDRKSFDRYSLEIIRP
ncbi:MULTISPECIES: DUF3426 domain-containing protein [Acinetobacter]|uniref:DUF3426 domain-containing protein n=1 Tax=Acinetobacter pseudolwoffii TaxID=2053287 RepID=N9KQP5_9GAMM|nr:MULTISPECIES: DUF3426 domain-containing protein [Acinetobacter]NLZ86201.1 DUF3426 domain-containing protein [Gammaproteobacteria bacterium]ENW86382.1 hypothetical protein F906_01436 [Acinetobacter pseudolwoffii]MCO8091680.1 zinc-ribbon and DUF3426 domain-containing protein [Acinetobacter pseudolwoffii]MCP0910623.1 zinc-ribbon and DUF3426 domain-containing protein [Acinetobacter pseudolwoffii]MDM1343275.1 DUF3426 domain-containing protein [Acinetobacter pseudolwoffii]